MNLATLNQLNVSRGNREAVVTVTELSNGHTFIPSRDASIPFELRTAISDVLQQKRPAAVTVGNREYFLNLYLPQPRLLIVGAVHISQALVRLAAIANFKATIVDPRTAFATPDRFPHGELLPVWPEEAFRLQPLDRNTALIALTHDPKIDDGAIQAALTAGCFYVGALGSRKTHLARLQRFAAVGIGVDMTDRIRAPIGLDIGATGPEEIAVAIMAEVIAVYHRRISSHKD